jgi:antitoxin (DNA-binding transcriptional repressor) of toxin-antitoxin stability system
MERATISELKNALSAYLKKVCAGQTVVVMDRDRPIARLERIDPSLLPDERLQRLARDGLLVRAKRPLDLAALRRPAPKPGRPVTEALLEERQEGR